MSISWAGSISGSEMRWTTETSDFIAYFLVSASSDSFPLAKQFARKVSSNSTFSSLRISSDRAPKAIL